MRRVLGRRSRQPSSSLSLNDRVTATLPLHRWRADAATTSSGNLSTLLNLGSGGGTLSVVSGTLAAPTTSALMGGRMVLSPDGSQYLQSSLPASSFRFLHSGTGGTVAHIIRLTATSGTQIISLSLTASTGHDLYAYSSGNARSRVFGGGAQLFDLSTPTAVGNVTLVGRYRENETPEATLLRAATQVSSDVTNPPSVGDSDTSFRLLGGIGGLNFAGLWAETMLWDRYLSDTEIATVRAYAAITYGA